MTIGIVGAGQLGRMLVLAGRPLGLQFRLLDPAADACAGEVAGQIIAPYDDPAALGQLAAQCEIVTFEFENVPAQAVARLSQDRPVYPSADALEVAQDRFNEKTLFGRLGIATPRFAAVNTEAELRTAVEAIGLPAVLKTRRLGYDGKGQFVLREQADIEKACWELGDADLILEAFVPFEREVSLVASRRRNGETVFYPLTENTHRNGILHLSIPRADDPLQAEAEAQVGRLLEELDYVGTLAFEFFVHQGRLLGNEIAPRVHNSGHWTIEGAVTSQFENHLRAILDWPLGLPHMLCPAAMLNFVGELPPAEAVLAIPGARFHDYGKAPRAGRKVGHATLLASSEEELATQLSDLLALVPGVDRGAIAHD